MTELIRKLMPILHVKDPDAERYFNERPGFGTAYEGPAYRASSPSAMTTSSSD
jgi:hypothetical protein